MTNPTTTLASGLAARPAIAVPLHDLFVAPENARADIDYPDDEGLTDLAGSLLTGGQILPLFVRASSDTIKPWAVLDGRRRLLALQGLEHDGDILPDHPVTVVVCETPDEIAAATVIANDQRLELSHADYLLAVHKLSQQFKSVDDIGRILGLDTKRVRQLSKLGSLDKRFLDAYRDETIRLTTLKKLAKVKDPEALAVLADQLEDTGVLYEHHVYNATLAGDQLLVTDPLVRFITLDAYLADGGTVEQDLFDEIPDTITDVPRLHKLWADKVAHIAAVLRDEGLTVICNPDRHTPDGMARTDWRWQDDPAQADAIAAAKEKAGAAADAAAAPGPLDPAWDTHTGLAALTFLDVFKLQVDPLIPAAARLSVDHAGDFDVTFYVERDAYEAHIAARKAAEAQAPKTSEVDASPAPAAPPVVIDTEGFQHLLHMKVTDLAGDGLAVTLADDPAVAFDLNLATQFRDIIHERAYGDQLLKLSATGSIPHDQDPLHAGIAKRLRAYLDAYRASKLHVFEWVRTLDGEAKADLLALITARMVSTREEKTNAIRPRTRAEAALVAAALDHTFADAWLPDETFYAHFTKKQLLGFLDVMGMNSPEAKKASRDELAPIVTAYATAKRFVPPQLNFELVAAPLTTTDTATEEDKAA